MKSSIFSTLLVLSTLITLHAQNHQFNNQSFVETTATVDTLVTPDKIYLEIMISEKDTKDKIPLEKMEDNMVKKLKELNINTNENLLVDDFSSIFNERWLKNDEVLKSRKYSLLVNDAPTAARVMMTLEKLEISKVSLDRVEYSKMDELELELKKKAVLRARLQAEFLVQPLNQQIGSAIYVKELFTRNFQNISQNRIRDIDALSVTSYGYEKKEANEVNIEKIKVESAVMVSFHLK